MVMVAMVAMRLLVPAEDPWSKRRKHVVEEVLDESSRDIEVTYCLLYTSPSPRDKRQSRMPSSA